MSSIVFKRSRSDENEKHFERENIFHKQLGAYDILTGDISSSKRFGVDGLGGIPLSYDDEHHKVYIDDADSHTLVIGSTGSKKSRLIAMPTVKILGDAQESMIIADPKAEIYKTLGVDLQKQGFEVFVINLRNPDYGNAWNPLAVPYRLYCEGNVDLAFEFANDITVNLSGGNDYAKDPFWGQSAASFFFGLIMLMFKIGRDQKVNAKDVNIWNIIQLRELLCDDEHRHTARKIKDYAKRDPFIYSLLRGTLETADVTRRGILAHFDQDMRTFSIQPKLLSMLSYDDNIMDKLRKQPTAIFLDVPDEKTSFHKLVSLFIKQSYEYFIFLAQKKKSNEDLGIRINYILDEFSSLPTIKDFPAMITAARSRKIRFNLFVQSKHQLDLRYTEEAHTIRANCTNWIFLVSRELSLLQEISELCGTKYTSDRQKPVLSITDLQHLDKECGEALVLNGRKKPFIAKLPDIKEYNISPIECEFKKYRRKNSVLDFTKILSFDPEVVEDEDSMATIFANVRQDSGKTTEKKTPQGQTRLDQAMKRAEKNLKKLDSSNKSKK